MASNSTQRLQLPALSTAILKVTLGQRRSLAIVATEDNGNEINVLYILSWLYFSFAFPISFASVALCGSE